MPKDSELGRKFLEVEAAYFDAEAKAALLQAQRKKHQIAIAKELTDRVEVFRGHIPFDVCDYLSNPSTFGELNDALIFSPHDSVRSYYETFLFWKYEKKSTAASRSIHVKIDVTGDDPSAFRCSFTIYERGTGQGFSTYYKERYAGTMSMGAKLPDAPATLDEVMAVLTHYVAIRRISLAKAMREHGMS
jgi:hypothetical protein